MTITLCGSIKFMDEMKACEKVLTAAGHTVYMPIKVAGVDYWEAGNEKRVDAKKKGDLIGEHFRKIEKSDAILVVNCTKKEILNYIGANTFLEMGFAHYKQKKVFLLNPLPDQSYLIDELLSIDPIILGGQENLATID